MTQYLKKKQAELAALGEWSHIDCLRSNARDDVRDDILRKLVFEKNASDLASAAPKPKSRVDALLSAIDIDNLSVDSETRRLSVHDVPGGTVSFLFEKSSKSTIQVVEEEDEGEDNRR